MEKVIKKRIARNHGCRPILINYVLDVGSDELTTGFLFLRIDNVWEFRVIRLINGETDIFLRYFFICKELLLGGGCLAVTVFAFSSP